MRDELIQIETRTISGDPIQTVNARDLHAFLEVGKDFSTWIKDRIQQYSFTEERDYISVQELSSPKSGSSKARNQLSITYHLSMDMAKELAMVERNDKGKQARQYFIECERRAKETANRDPMQVLSDPAAMRGLLLTYTEKVLALEHKVGELEPKANALERIADAEGAMNCTLAAKSLQIAPKRLFEWLREHHWIYRRPGGSGNVAYQDKIQAGYLKHKITTVQREDGSDKVVEQVLVTGKGLAKLSQALGTH